MARSKPTERGESRAHEAAESPEFERGEESEMKENKKKTVVKHLGKDIKEQKQKIKEDKELRSRVKG